MKIDFVVPRLHPSGGGIEEAIRQLATGLQRKHHTVLLHTSRTGNQPAKESWDGIPIRRYKPRFSLGYYASRFEPELSGDLVHLHAYAHLTNDWVVRQNRGRRPVFLSTHHGAGFPKPAIGARLYHALYNYALGFRNVRRLDGVFVPTEFDRVFFATRGVEPARLHLLPSGADEAAFRAHKPWIPPTLRGRDGFFLFLGRLHEEKGIPELLKAYHASALTRPLVLAGHDEGVLDRLADDLVSDARIHFVTDFTSEQKWGLLAACHALVLPSRHEGQGIVVAEAWAQRKPVIASHAGGLPYVVDDERNGLLVETGNVGELRAALERLDGDAALAERLGAAGRAKAEREFRWEPILEKVESIYRAVMGERSAGTVSSRAGAPRA